LPISTRPLTIRLRIASQAGIDSHAQELQVRLVKPIRLGRTDPVYDILPEIDLTQNLGREYGVSREHACIFQQGNMVKVEDLG
jgi:hypothetical protein